MNEKEIDGKTYILKTDVENIIKSRISKVAERASIAEQKTAALEEALQAAEKKHASVDILSQRVEQLQKELESSGQKFSRYQAITKHGLSDSDVIDAIEWQFDKEMSKRPKKEQVNLSDWLEKIVADPSTAPTVLRPHLQSLQPETAAPQNDATTSEPAPPTTQNAQIPQTNKGVRPAPQTSFLLDPANLNKQGFYEQHRAQIKEAFRNSRRRNGLNEK